MSDDEPTANLLLSKNENMPRLINTNENHDTENNKNMIINSSWNHSNAEDEDIINHNNNYICSSNSNKQQLSLENYWKCDSPKSGNYLKQAQFLSFETEKKIKSELEQLNNERSYISQITKDAHQIPEQIEGRDAYDIGNWINKDENNDFIIEENCQNDYTYDPKLVECKQKLRNAMEWKIKEQIKEKLKPKIQKEIYSKEYNNIYSQIKKEIETELQEEHTKKQNEERAYIKKNIMCYLKIKEDDIEKEIKIKCEEEMEEEFKRELNIKEKEMKLKTMQKYEAYKSKFEKNLLEEFEKKQKGIMKEIDEYKSNTYRSKCSEKLKMNKINWWKKNIKAYREKNMKTAEQVEQILNHQESENEEDVSQHENMSGRRMMKERGNECQIPQTKKSNIIVGGSSSSNNYNISVQNLMPPQEQVVDKSSGSVQVNNSVNIFEINKKIKEAGKITTTASKESGAPSNNQNPLMQYPLSHVNDNSFVLDNKIPTQRQGQNQLINQKMCHKNQVFPTYNNTSFQSLSPSTRTTRENPNHQFNENLNNYKLHPQIQQINTVTSTASINSMNINKSSKPNSHLIHQQATSNNPNAKTITNYVYKKAVPQNEFVISSSPQKSKFYSWQIDQNIPTSISDFGKYLIYHIEKEENYRVLFSSEIKKYRIQIRKIFQSSGLTDHCMTDYMIEIWNKLEVSYCTRYSIVQEMVKCKANDMYLFIDRETEYWTDYYQITEDIFNEIKDRESLKLKLQMKTNKNEPIAEDKLVLDSLTNKLDAMIKKFKSKNPNLDVIWKGWRYEWFMNYENWFYSMGQKGN